MAASSLVLTASFVVGVLIMPILKVGVFDFLRLP